MNESVPRLHALFEQHATETERAWLESKRALAPPALLQAFVAAPRFIRKIPVELPTDAATFFAEQYPGYALTGWPLDRLTRVLLLLTLPSDDEEQYVGWLDTLFSTAEVNELVALYSALPLLPYPERWRFRATEGVRSNMAPVFDAMALDNPYPARYLDETGWNQLVLKSIFNDKPLDRIVGFAERANQRLADTLSDFAHERWAAGRTVPPYAWRLTTRYLNETLLGDLRVLLQSERPEDRQVAAFVLSQTDSEPARRLLQENLSSD
jgi:hypothetical protein